MGLGHGFKLYKSQIQQLIDLKGNWIARRRYFVGLKTCSWSSTLHGVPELMVHKLGNNYNTTRQAQYIMLTMVRTH